MLPGDPLVSSGLGGIYPRGIPVGVVTAIIGAPFFLWLVVRLRGDLDP